MPEPEIASAPSLTRLLYTTFREQASATAQLIKQDGQYYSHTYAELNARVEGLATFLIRHGIQPGERVVLLAESGPLWAWTDLATLWCGAVGSAIYPQATADEVAHILGDLDAAAVVVDSADQLAKVRTVRDRLPALRHVLCPPDIHFERQTGETALPDLFGEPAFATTAERSELMRRIAAVGRDDPVCVIYTSGTTGPPKGVVLTHANYLGTIAALLDYIPDHQFLQRTLSFLPMAHSFERLSGHYLVLAMGRCVAYAERMETVVEDMMAVRPHLVTAVPRFFEKAFARIMAGLAEAPPWRRALFEWARGVGERARISGRKGLAWRLADRLVFTKVRQRFGGELHYFISGGAPLSAEIAAFFHDIGIVILEGYGATEVTAPATLTHPDDIRFGCVGRPLPGVEIRIAEDGEIELRGPNRFREYWRQAAATAEAITADGYYRTGDIGRLDEAGRVYITDRKKQLIVTAGGKNIAPAPIEQGFVTQPHIDIAYIHGDRRPYLCALIVPDFAALADSARRIGLNATDPAALMADPRLRAMLDDEVSAVNGTLARYAQIKKYRYLETPFSVGSGELTHTLKLRRKVIAERYRDVIESMYAEGRPPT